MPRRYYSPDDPESYVTPSRLKRLSRSKQVEYIAHWFSGMFEDPQNETPYAIDEHSPYNYEYIWGGPYDARDQIGDEFGGIVSDDVIDLAVAEVERDGVVEWAPGRNHPDQRRRSEDALSDAYETQGPSLDEIRTRLDSGVVPTFGSPHELSERAALRHLVAELAQSLSQELHVRPGIGHNGPPDDLRLTVEVISYASRATNQMGIELAKGLPDVSTIIESTSRLQSVLSWMLRKADKAVDSFAGAIGTAGGVAAVAQLAGFPVAEKISRVVQAATEWLSAITLPF